MSYYKRVLYSDSEFDFMKVVKQWTPTEEQLIEMNRLIKDNVKRKKGTAPEIILPPTTDGVYCDASKRPHGMIIAIVRVKDSKVEVFHTILNGTKDVNIAEQEAINLAKQLYPGDPIYSDNQAAAHKCKVNWIPRKSNRYADKVARKQMGKRL